MFMELELAAKVYLETHLSKGKVDTEGMGGKSSDLNDDVLLLQSSQAKVCEISESDTQELYQVENMIGTSSNGESKSEAGVTSGRKYDRNV